jgi:tetratricopeptide (TPR) repeat protein
MNLLFYLIILLALPLNGETPEETWQTAIASYQKGEKAKTYEERKLAFNHALFLYSSLEKEGSSHSPTLDLALADTYFQLGKYPWAILYYHRTLKKDPSHSLARTRLEKAQQKLGLPPSIPSDQEKGSFFAFLSRQFQLLLGIMLLTFLALSCAIWFPIPWIRKLAFSFVLILSLLIGNSLFFYYFTPLEGILVKSTGFYRAPAWNQPQITNRPLLAGSKVQILQITPDQEWLKIQNSYGIIGYIPADTLRAI